MLSRLKLWESRAFISLRIQAPTTVIYDNQLVIVVDNIKVIDAKKPGTFLEGQRKNKKNPGLEHPRRSMLRPKERWRYGGSLCFPHPENPLVKSPVLDQGSYLVPDSCYC